MSNLQNWLWYSSVLGIGAANISEVLTYYPTAEDLLNERGKAVPACLTPLQRENLVNKEPKDMQPLINECKAKNVGIVTIDSDDYPESLRNIPSPPLVLFYKGNIKILNSYFLFAMIGTRRPSAYGVRATQEIVQELCKNGMAIVSGLADGLDSVAHIAALKENVPTVACLAFGHDICYPTKNRSLINTINFDGVSISEYPPNTGVQRHYFLARNRIIAALSRGVCIAEARSESGTMNTVMHALEYGKDVFCVPGSVYSDLSAGTNALIKEGANLVVSAKDILEFYAIEYNKKIYEQEKIPEFSLSAEAKLVLKLLSQIPKPAEVLCMETKLSPARTMAALTELEISGKARQLSGRQFELY